MNPHMSPERYSDEENNHTILPLHCVVQVTGNNRTKLALLGQRGVIIQAGDLGGWHTLVRGSFLLHRMRRYTQCRSIRRCSRAASKYGCSAMP